MSGPFGGPRISDIGPFSNQDIVVNEQYDSQSLIQPTREFQDLLDYENLPSVGAVLHSLSIEVKQDPSQSRLDIVDELKNMASDIGRSIAYTEYVTQDEIGYIRKTFVEDTFRNRGVGSAISITAVERMRESGIKKIYTYPINAGGEAVARSMGFKRSEFQGFWVKTL